MDPEGGGKASEGNASKSQNVCKKKVLNCICVCCGHYGNCLWLRRTPWHVVIITVCINRRFNIHLKYQQLQLLVPVTRRNQYPKLKLVTSS